MDVYSDDNRINNYLKLLEKEIIRIQKYFDTKDKRYMKKVLIIWEKIYLE